MQPVASVFAPFLYCALLGRFPEQDYLVRLLINKKKRIALAPPLFPCKSSRIVQSQGKGVHVIFNMKTPLFDSG